MSDDLLTLSDLRELLNAVKTRKPEVSKRTDSERVDASFSSLRELQRCLLEDTMKYVYENCRYYRDSMNDLGLRSTDIHDAENLSRLPFIKRSVLENNIDVLMSKVARPAYVVTTSGTTGKPLAVYLSEEEVDAIKILREISLSLSAEATKRRVSIVLSLNALGHGIVPRSYGHTLPISDPVDFHAIYAPGSQKFSTNFYHFVQTLFTPLHVSSDEKVYPTIIFGIPFVIELLTQEMLKRGIDPKSTAIEYISTTGSYFPQVTREFVSQAWDATIIDTYSMAEHCGSATSCEHGIGHHFDITAMPEVVDFETGKRLPPSEEGVLVLTSFYPFRQCVPLIRYWTDDIVTLTDEKCNCGFNGLSIKEFIGRAQNCVYLGHMSNGKHKFVSSARITDVLIRFPEFRVFSISAPNFRIRQSTNGRQSIVKVEIESYRTFSNNEDKNLKNAITEDVMKAHEWDKSFPSAALEIDFLSPGTLPNLYFRPNV